MIYQKGGLQKDENRSHKFDASCHLSPHPSPVCDCKGEDKRNCRPRRKPNPPKGAMIPEEEDTEYGAKRADRVD